MVSIQLILENCILMSKPLYHVHPGIMEILKHADINLEGKMQLLLVVVILLANLFQSYCCKLTQLLRFTFTYKNMNAHLKQADVIVSAVGQPGLVTKENVKKAQ